MATFDLGYPPSLYRPDLPGYNGTALQTFFAKFPDDDACLDHVFRVRFNSDPICSRCGNNGRWKKHKCERHYFHPCGGISSPMMNTVFERTKVPLQLWFYAMLCFTNSAEGMSSRYLARQIGVSEPTAFHMGHRIRAQMAAVDRHRQIGGVGKKVFIRIAKMLNVRNFQKNSPNRVYLLIISDDQRVTCAALRKPRRGRLSKLLNLKTVHGSQIETDCIFTYRSLNSYGSSRDVAKFSPNILGVAKSRITLNHGLLQYINLSFHDEYKGVDLEKSWLYFKEYEYRYNRRKNYSGAFWDLLSDFSSLDAENFAKLKLQNFISD